MTTRPTRSTRERRPGLARRRTRHRGGALRGLAALVVLLALTAGIPVALVALTATSFPHGVPGLDAVVHGLTGPDDGSLFLAVLTLAAWAGWATFALAVLLEIPAQLRGVPAVRVRGLGVQQSLAGGLVAAVLAIVLVPGAASAAERTSGNVGPARPTVTSGAAPGPTIADAARAAPAARAAVPTLPGDSATPAYAVRHGDTLWDIAAVHLGDGTRWRQVAALNYDRPQPDGAHLDRSHVLRAGWRLALPVAPRPAGGEGDHGSAGLNRAYDRVVRPGDTLSGIAEQELGDAGRYSELAQATRDVVQPDGRHLEDPDLIYPGWRIEVPGQGATQSPAPPAAPHTPGPAESTPTRSAPAGPSPLTARPGPPAADDDPLDPSWGSGSSRLEAPTVQPAHGVRAVTGAGRASAPAIGGSPDTEVRDGDDADGLLDDLVSTRTAGGAGGLLAACVVLLLGARRLRQQHRRRPGERIPLPATRARTTETQLRAVADRAGVEHVDLALRALAAERRSTGGDLPQLRSLRLTPSHLELHFAEAAQLPLPWTATSDPTVWALTQEELTSAPARDTPAPYPSLVTVGQDLEGASVLVDLEHLTTLAIEGSTADTLPILAAMAVELGTSPWADDLLVTLVGCLPELPPAVASGRLRHLEHVEQLVADLEGRARDVERVLRDASLPDLPAARAAAGADDAWSPEIVLLAGDVPAAFRSRLDDVLYRVPRVGVAAVTTGSDPLGEWRLQLAAGDTARLDPLGLTLRPQRLADDEYAHVLDLLRTTDADPVPGPGWAAALPSGELPSGELPRSDLPSPADLPDSVVAVDIASAAHHHPSGDSPADHPPADQPHQDDHSGNPSDGVVRLRARPPYVRLLGSVEVLHATGPEPVSLKNGKAMASHLARATALVAYLVCHPGGATVAQVSEALSPIRRISPSTVWSLASRTRTWLGSDPDGNPYYPRTADAGSNRLHPAVRSDWQDWLDLVGPDIAQTPTPHLVQALALVRGRPFEGVQERHFAWAEPLRQEMLAAVVDVAHEVARRALEIPDAALARQAAMAGRLVDPTNELLWRDALRAEYVAGNREGQRHLVEQLYALTDDLETDLEPATERLVAELDRWSGARVAR